MAARISGLGSTGNVSRLSLQKLRPNPAVDTDRPGHLAHIGAGGFAEGGDAVDRADALRQEGVGGEPAAPEVGAQDAPQSMIIPIVIIAMLAAAPSERVTVTMPADLIAGIDRYERNRSRFIADAVRHELKRRRRQELLRSLEEPHPECITTSSLGLKSWSQGLPAGDDDLLDPRGGVPLRWSEEQGWQEPEA
mgnify:CR=1 FL=1